MKQWAKSMFQAVVVLLAMYGIGASMAFGAIHAAKMSGITVAIAVDGGTDQ